MVPSGNKKFAQMEDVKKYQGWSILVDCDGVLTNGQKIVDATGKRQMIAFHSRDSIACKALVEMGFQIIVLTNSNFGGIRNYWDKYGATIIWAQGKDYLQSKWKALSHYKDDLSIDWEKTIGIGDDITDDCYLEKCEFSYLVFDCNTYYRDDNFGGYKYPRFKSFGGDGVLAELVDKINKNTLYAEN